MNEWLGRRDSNPDTQIQSSLKSPAAQSDEQVSSANQREVGQNPQHERNKPRVFRDASIEAQLASPPDNLACFDFEEDTLP